MLTGHARWQTLDCVGAHAHGHTHPSLAHSCSPRHTDDGSLCLSDSAGEGSSRFPSLAAVIQARSFATAGLRPPIHVASTVPSPEQALKIGGEDKFTPFLSPSLVYYPFLPSLNSLKASRIRQCHSPAPRPAPSLQLLSAHQMPSPGSSSPAKSSPRTLPGPHPGGHPVFLPPSPSLDHTSRARCL